MLRTNKTPMTRAAATAIALLSSVSLLIGQTQIIAPPNKYKISDDVKEGQDAARQVEEQLPMLNDSQVQSYVANIGARLAESIPPGISASGIPLHVQGGQRERHQRLRAAGRPDVREPRHDRSGQDRGRSGGRHGARDEPRRAASWHGAGRQGHAVSEVGSMAGQILGAIMGGTAGQVVSGGTQFGAGMAFTKFSREYEKQADLLGSHIMATAGYDPRDMANMFKTIEKISGNGGPQLLSDHPNPSNRYQYINDEAGMLHVTNPIRDTRAFRGHPESPAPHAAGAHHRAGDENRQSPHDAVAVSVGEPDGTCRSAIRAVQNVRRGRPVPHLGAGQLAGAAGQHQCVVRAAGRLRRLSGAERLHARHRSGDEPQ